MLAEAKQNTKI